jgi:AcrR family transcriptional regulator
VIQECPRRGPGRPRDPGCDRAILDAAADILAAEGYDRLSFEGVAARAGVGKPTVYRRWPTKPALVIDAVLATIDFGAVAVTGDLEADLRAAVRNHVRAMSTGRGAELMGGVAAAIARDPELAEAWRSRVLRPRRAHLRGTLERVVEAGIIGAHVDLDLFLDCLVGPVCIRLLFTGEPVSPAIADALIDLLLDGARPAVSGRKHHKDSKKQVTG